MTGSISRCCEKFVVIVEHVVLGDLLHMMIVLLGAALCLLKLIIFQQRQYL